MQINLLTDGFKDSEKFYQAFLDDTLQQSSFVSDAYVNIPTALPDFPIFFAIRDPKERENEYCKMIKIIAEYVINLDRDIFMDERFWHSWFSLYKREYLLNTYPQIKEDYNTFKNIVIKRFDWENYIYKAILIAQYVEVDERPWVLELVYKTKEDIILGAHGKTRFLENIVTYNKEYYTDVLTGAYSRRYYEEYVQYINDVSAVAMIDADNFKAINDQYGHNAGDQAIKAVSKAIQSCIRPDDIFIRYGGDEFVLIFQDIHYDAFTTRLYQISECVKRTKVDDYEDLSLSITVGGIYGNSKVNDAIKKADKLMYEGKKSKRSVVVKKTSEVD